jgi:hypothetical protein
MGEELEMEIDGCRFSVDLYVDRAPAACAAMREKMPLGGEIIHARLSGPLGLLRRINLADAPLENPVAFLDPGDIVYHSAHFDVGIV